MSLRKRARQCGVHSSYKSALMRHPFQLSFDLDLELVPGVCGRKGEKLEIVVCFFGAEGQNFLILGVEKHLQKAKPSSITLCKFLQVPGPIDDLLLLRQKCERHALTVRTEPGEQAPEDVVLALVLC